MKNQALSNGAYPSGIHLQSLLKQVNDMLLTARALVRENGAVNYKKAKKQYGFRLRRVPSGDYGAGFYYTVTYKDPDAPKEAPETGKWLGNRVSTGTDDEAEAVAFAIENRDSVVRKYKERKAGRAEKNSGEAFYRMLREYYRDDSKYLRDDRANGKKDVVKTQRHKFDRFIETYLIPYLRENNVNTINDVTRSVYAGLKTHMLGAKGKAKGKPLAKKTINNGLMGFTRILEYHERHELITRLPYGDGEACVSVSHEDRAKTRANQPSILPTDKLAGILQSDIFFSGDHDKGEFDPVPYLLGMLCLACGMRNSEIGRLRVCDIKRIKGLENAYYLEAFNHKTKAHNREGAEYRKIPLHPFMVARLREYITSTEKGKNDYLFGKPVVDADTGETDGKVDRRLFEKAVLELYKRIKIKERLWETGDMMGALAAFDDKGLRKEMRENKISFYSMRHTFQTLLLTMYQDKVILTDYFMGHKPQQAMLANYLHINRVDEATFWNEYGRYLVDFQAQFMPSAKQAERRDFVRGYMSSLWDKSENGSVDVFEEFNRLMEKLPVPNDAEWADELYTDPASFFQKALEYNGLNESDSPDARMIREVLIPLIQAQMVKQSVERESLQDDPDDDFFDSV